ncbi:hypothetical protein GCM10027422_27900 [Hymenobacter arcticus]
MKTKGYLYKEIIASGLGQFELQVAFTGEGAVTKSAAFATVITSTAHTILIKRTVAPVAWLPAYMSVDKAQAWLFYITKHSTEPEQLTVSLSLANKLSFTESGADTGQYLTAVEFENGVRQVHLGTQDEDWFACYNEKIGMPSRLVPALTSYKLTITTIEEAGLRTQVPDLLLNEQFYFHYILAESSRRKSIEYPAEWDVSTWYAVDQDKQSLEEAWSKQIN